MLRKICNILIDVVIPMVTQKKHYIITDDTLINSNTMEKTMKKKTDHALLFLTYFNIDANSINKNGKKNTTYIKPMNTT